MRDARCYSQPRYNTRHTYTSSIKKVAHTRLPSIGFWSWSRFLAVSLQVTWVINPALLPLLSAKPAVTPTTLKRAATNFAAWWTEARWVWTVCLRLLPDSIATATLISVHFPKLVLSRLQPHVMKSANYCEFQSAYRKSHSTETVVNNIQRAAGNGQCTALLALDISAFDAVDHATLTDRARTVFGIHDVALDWLW